MYNFSDLFLPVLVIFVFSETISGGPNLNDYRCLPEVQGYLHNPDAMNPPLEVGGTVLRDIESEKGKRQAIHFFRGPAGPNSSKVIAIDITKGILFDSEIAEPIFLGAKKDNVLHGHGSLQKASQHPSSSATTPSNLEIVFFTKPGEPLNSLSAYLISHGEYDLAERYQELFHPGSWDMRSIPPGGPMQMGIFEPLSGKEAAIVYREYPPPIAYSSEVNLYSLVNAYSRHFPAGSPPEVLMLPICRYFE